MKVMYLRMPDAMHDAIKRRAAEEDRSMAGIIRVALRRYLATDETTTTTEARDE